MEDALLSQFTSYLQMVLSLPDSHWPSFFFFFFFFLNKVVVSLALEFLQKFSRLLIFLVPNASASNYTKCFASSLLFDKSFKSFLPCPSGFFPLDLIAAAWILLGIITLCVKMAPLI